MKREALDENFIVYYESDTRENMRYKLMISLAKQLGNILLVSDEDMFIAQLERSNCLWWIINYYWLSWMSEIIRDWKLSTILKNKLLWLYSCKANDESWKELIMLIPNTKSIYRNEKKPRKSASKIEKVINKAFSNEKALK